VPNNILITPGSASIQFSGSLENTIRLQVNPSGNVGFISESVSLLDINRQGIIITGSLRMNSGGITGSLFGTSSVATTSSFATTSSAATSITFTPSTASFATTAATASSFTGYINFPNGLDVSGSLNILSGSINVTNGGITGSLTSGSVTNISQLSMLVSGTITASGTTSVTLNLNTANYFSVSASGAGTVTWAVTNLPVTDRAQTFVIEYTNGGIKTNNWFTNTRWPAGIAPSLTSASANPDMLSFTTDDAGSNLRGLLLQRGSA